MLCGFAVVYLAIVVSIYRDRHLKPPAGKLANAPTGAFTVIKDTSYQISTVFQSQTVTIKRLPGGDYQIVGANGQSLRLVEGRDGLYFSDDFRPVGAFILPGIARNWNEGRISVREDAVIVEGYMLEKGLMLFAFPFKDVIEWQLELRSVTPPNNAADSL